MKIAIISDTHDNIFNLEKALSWINSQNIPLIIHCGDLCAPSVLTEILVKKFPHQIYLIHGNVGDRELLEEKVKNLKNVKLFGDFGEIEIDNKKIAFVHKPEEAKKIAQTEKYDLVFYGHTHKPWEEKIGKTKLVNPGNLAGMFYKATFAIYETKTDKLELKILETLR
jgi:putative phosphoesterase